jgi:aminoglycoside phosphotransferase (APT) family kinase protein
MPGFPTAPAELTTDWLSAITGHTVTDFHTAPLGEGVGVIGWVNRAELETAAGPSSVIVKFAATAPENRTVAITYDMYGREIRFYRDLAARVPIRTPQCLAAEYDPQTHDFVLVLEDLRRCRVGDQLAGADRADAERVVRLLGALHGSTWNRPLEGVISHDFPAQSSGMAEGFRVGWPAVLERFPDLVSDQARTHAPRLAEQIPALIRELTESDQCLVHADVRLDNVLFDGDDTVLVDWQSVCTSSGEQDLAYFLTQSLADEVWARDAEALVRLYHATLEEQGVTDHPLERCRERFRIASVYLLSWAVVIAGTLDMGNERGRDLARTLLGRSLRAVEDLDAFAALR